MEQEELEYIVDDFRKNWKTIKEFQEFLDSGLLGDRDYSIRSTALIKKRIEFEKLAEEYPEAYAIFKLNQ